MKQITKSMMDEACFKRGQIPENVPLTIKIQWAKLDYQDDLLYMLSINEKELTRIG